MGIVVDAIRSPSGVWTMRAARALPLVAMVTANVAGAVVAFVLAAPVPARCLPSAS